MHRMEIPEDLINSLKRIKKFKKFHRESTPEKRHLQIHAAPEEIVFTGLTRLIVDNQHLHIEC